MKNFIKIIGFILTISRISILTASPNSDPYLSNDIVESVKEIKISKLLDFKKIAAAIHDEFDKARFYYIIAFEIDSRQKKLDTKFNNNEKKYLKVIRKYENELDLTPYKYTNERPRFDYVYQATEITQETVESDIHRIQAVLARTQFIQIYKYYRKRLDNYKNYVSTLRELYKCNRIANTDNKVEFYSNFSEMYQGIKLFHDSMDDAGKMHVQRDALGKVLSINWNEEGEDENTRQRRFEYFNDGTLAKLIDTIKNETVSETWFGENEIADDFLDYIFSAGFTPRDYSYYTEVYYKDGKISAYRFSTMNDHIIGTIFKEYDEKDHLIKEAWCKGETSKLLREFSSIFDPATGGYKLIERDKNGNIVKQEIILSSND